MSTRGDDPKQLIEISKNGLSIVIHNGCTLLERENGCDSNLIKAFPLVTFPSGEKNIGDFSCDWSSCTFCLKFSALDELPNSNIPRLLEINDVNLGPFWK